MKRKLGWAAAVIVLVAAAFGGGALYRQGRVRELEQRMQGMTLEQQHDNMLLASANTMAELCRAQSELGQNNFGNAAARLESAQKAAAVSGRPELRALDGRFTEARAAVQKLDTNAKQLVEALITDTSR
jgi:hypothetical protein